MLTEPSPLVAATLRVHQCNFTSFDYFKSSDIKMLAWDAVEGAKTRPRMSCASDENLKKIVNSITIQANALDPKEVRPTILMYLDERERDVFQTPSDTTSSQFEDYRIKSEVGLAIQFFRHNRFAEMIDRCRILNNDFPEEKLRKFKLL